jgi:hypothetical protein
MNTFIACVLAEHAKLHRTLARGLAIAAPACAVLLSLFVLANLDTLANANDMPRWQAYLDTLLRIWASFLLPIMATLQAVLIAQLEHANRQWKYLLALPVSRTSLYMAKSVNLLALLLLAHVVLCALALGACVAFGLASGALGEAAGFLARQSSATFIAAWVLAAVQLGISIRLESFVGAIGIGLVATLVALLGAGPMGKAAGYFPWSMPIHALQPISAAWLAGAVLAAVLITAVGTQLLNRMQVR